MGSVSVVIPTVGRRQEQLTRAVASALAQGESIEEVLVVLDDPTRRDTMPAFQDPRVRVLVKDSAPRGPAAARNYGAAAAGADVVALLDDDDYWLPGKIDAQLRALGPRTVVATRTRILAADGETFVQPDAPPESAEKMADYLFPAPGFRRSPNHSVYPSSWLLPTRLLLDRPFDEGLAHWEDLNWLLGTIDDGATLTWVWEALTVCDHTRSSGLSQSQTGTPAEDEDWAESALRPRSRAAYQNHVLTYAVPGFARSGARARALRLLIEALREGPVTPALLAKAVVGLTVPAPLWERARAVRERLSPRNV